MQSALRLLRTAVGAWLLPAALLRLLPGLLTAALFWLLLRGALLLAAGRRAGVGHQRHPAKAVLVTSPRPPTNRFCARREADLRQELRARMTKKRPGLPAP